MPTIPASTVPTIPPVNPIVKHALMCASTGGIFGAFAIGGAVDVYEFGKMFITSSECCVIMRNVFVKTFTYPVGFFVLGISFATFVESWEQFVTHLIE